MNNDESIEEYTVGEVSVQLGVSVRTLRYWEERGLLTPVARSWANYRIYTAKDIERAQHIIIYRGAGMSLEKIAEIFADTTDTVEILHQQRDLLMTKQNELHLMVTAVEKLLEAAMNDTQLTPEEIGRILGDSSFAEYHEEAENTWGETCDWQISQRNQGKMKEKDWEDIKEKTQQLESKLVEACTAGIAPGSHEANELIEQHRALLSRFFPVSHEKHVLIARGYVSDPRFTQHYDAQAEGLARWLQESINANAAHHGYDPDKAQWR